MTRGKKILVFTGTLALALVTLSPWSAESCLQGRYSSQGTLLLADGSSTQVSHTVQFSDQRFYGLSRQQGMIVEFDGRVEKRQKGHFQLIVEKGNASKLDANADDYSLFAHLFLQRSGSVINLTAIDDCLYATETSQVYCRD